MPVPEDIVNNFGYEELAKGNIQTAIDYFKRNIRENPNSANAFDKLADGYGKAGMWQEAIVASARSVELAKKYKAPNLAYYKEHVKKLKKKSKSKSQKQNKS